MEVEEKSQRGEDCKKTKDLESANKIQDMRNMKSTGLTDENLKGFVGGLQLIEQNYNRTRSFIIDAKKSSTRSSTAQSGILKDLTERETKTLRRRQYQKMKDLGYWSKIIIR
uniref:Uncharacterized protein n=1 Tax=Oryza glumipatula TaxID=40148 RepID=A0A0E0ATF7_9ORYZ